MVTDLKHEFLAYCEYYNRGEERDTPLNKRTVGRYLRGLKHVEKILGHDLNTVTNEDQLKFIEEIPKHPQGTRRVDCQIFQRMIHWGIKNGHFTCDNLLIKVVDDLIGPNTPVSYVRVNKKDAIALISRTKQTEYRAALGLIYFHGLTPYEVINTKKVNLVGDTLAVRREVSKEAQLISLKPSIVEDLEELRSITDSDRFFNVELSETAAKGWTTKALKQAQLDTGLLMGIRLKDLRTTGIRNFFEVSNDLELTRAYAGVPPHKKGWFDELMNASEHDLRKVRHARVTY